MQNEDQVVGQLKDIQRIAQENKKVDATALAFQALAQAQADQIAVEKKKRAYWVSVLLPPFGLFYAVRYLFADTQDGKRVALICTLLTAVSGVAAVLFSLAITNSLTAEQQTQVQSVKLEDYSQMQDLLK